MAEVPKIDLLNARPSSLLPTAPHPTFWARVQSMINEAITQAGGGSGLNSVLIQGQAKAVVSGFGLALDTPLPSTPQSLPLVFVYSPQDSGTKANAFYWSNDGGVTARAPQAGDYLYANITKLGFPLETTDPISLTYFTSTQT